MITVTDLTTARLRAFLGCAVTLRLLELRRLPREVVQDRIAVRQHELAQIIAEQGDVIQFKTQGRTAPAANALAEALAYRAFAPGGVTFLSEPWGA